MADGKAHDMKNAIKDFRHTLKLLMIDMSEVKDTKGNPDQCAGLGCFKCWKRLRTDGSFLERA